MLVSTLNMAEVSITYRKDDNTRFYVLTGSEKTDFITKKIRLKKAEKKGWIYFE